MKTKKNFLWLKKVDKETLSLFLLANKETLSLKFKKNKEKFSLSSIKNVQKTKKHFLCFFEKV